jgi:hypothetical protein
LDYEKLFAVPGLTIFVNLGLYDYAFLLMIIIGLSSAKLKGLFCAFTIAIPLFAFTVITSEPGGLESKYLQDRGISLSINTWSGIGLVITVALFLWCGRVVRARLLSTTSKEYSLEQRNAPRGRWFRVSNAFSSLPLVLLLLLVYGSILLVQLLGPGPLAPGTPRDIFLSLLGSDFSAVSALLFVGGLIGGVRGALATCATWFVSVIGYQVVCYLAAPDYSISSYYPFIQATYDMYLSENPTTGSYTGVSVPLLDWVFAVFGVAVGRHLRAVTSSQRARDFGGARQAERTKSVVKESAEQDDEAGSEEAKGDPVEITTRPPIYGHLDLRRVPPPFRFANMDKIWSSLAGISVGFLVLQALILWVHALTGPSAGTPADIVPNAPPDAGAPGSGNVPDAGSPRVLHSDTPLPATKK